MNKKMSMILMLLVLSVFSMSSPQSEEIETLLNNGLTDTAEKLVQKLLLEHPDDLQLNYYLSVVYYQQKNFDKLAKQVDRCIILLESSIATEAPETARMKFKISFYTHLRQFKKASIFLSDSSGDGKTCWHYISALSGRSSRGGDGPRCVTWAGGRTPAAAKA